MKPMIQWRSHALVVLLAVVLIMTMIPGVPAYAADWTTAYESFLSQNLLRSGTGYTIGSTGAEFDSFILIDWNKDQQPDLFLCSGEYGFGPSVVYTLRGSAVVRVCQLAPSAISQITLNRRKNDKKQLYVVHTREGDASASITEYSDITSAITRFKVVAATNNRNGAAQHYVGNKKVSKSTYNARYRNYLSKLKQLYTFYPVAMNQNPLSAYQSAVKSFSSASLPEIGNTKVKSLSLNETSITLSADGYHELSAKVKPASASGSIRWSSSNANIARVTGLGAVTAMGQPGTCVITASSVNGKTATCTVTVKGVMVSSITLPASANVGVGKTITLTPQVLPTGAANKKVTWQSSNLAVARVSDQGVVTGVATGTATITATATDGSDKRAACVVTVKENALPVTSVALSASSSSVAVGKTLQLTATVKPDNATNKSILWTTSNASVATVNGSGFVTAVKAGSATITATAADGSKKSAACVVTVKESAVPVTSVALSASSSSVTAGKTLQLTATVKPDNATTKSILWTTSSASVATVNGSGLVTAVKAGTATITATAADGSNKKATCTITVTDILPTSVALNSTSLTLNWGQTYQMTATVTPTNASNKTVAWSSSNPSVASVNGNGLITTHKKGSTVITAKTAAGGVKRDCSLTVVNPALSLKVTPNKTSALVNETFSYQVEIVGGSGKYTYSFRLLDPKNAVRGTGTRTLSTTSPTKAAQDSVQVNWNGKETLRLEVTAIDDAGTKQVVTSQNVTVDFTPLSVSVTPSKTSVKTGEAFEWVIKMTGGTGSYTLAYKLYNSASQLVAQDSFPRELSDYRATFTQRLNHTHGEATTLRLDVTVTDTLGNKKSLSSAGVVVQGTTPSIEQHAANFVNKAISQIGVQEVNGKTKYGEAFGNPTGDWCGYFVMWCGREVGIYNNIIKPLAYIPNVASTYGSRFVTRSSGYLPDQGDLIIFDGNSNGTPDHIGIVDYRDASKVYYIDGNTSSGNSGSVYVEYHNRPLNNGTIYGYVKFRG